MRGDIFRGCGGYHVADAVLLDSVANKPRQRFGGNALPPSGPGIGILDLRFPLAARMDDAAEPDHPGPGLQFNGKHAVSALLVVGAGDFQPVAALVFGDGLTVTNPSHRVSVAINRHQVRQIRLPPPPHQQSFGCENEISHLLTRHGSVALSRRKSGLASRPQSPEKPTLDQPGVMGHHPVDHEKHDDTRDHQGCKKVVIGDSQHIQPGPHQERRDQY